MQEDTPNNFQRRLFEVLDDLNRTGAQIAARGPRVSGPQCRLDRATFELLAEAFPRRQYSFGVMQGFAQVKNLTRPGDLERAAQATAQSRKAKGHHCIHVQMFQNELDEVNLIAKKEELVPSAVLEATTYLFVRATTDSRGRA